MAGDTWCKLKSMHNERGERVRSAPPSSAVVTTGWKTAPTAGDMCLQVGDLYGHAGVLPREMEGTVRLML